jgi:hypothetical protein
MGLLSDQDGILRRFVNEGQSWNEHIANTTKVIINFIEEKNVKTVSIFGSGWMLDVPVQYLASSMNKVIFYDLRHPKAVRDRYDRYSNFEFITMDLTGGLIETFYSLCHRKIKPSFDELIGEIIHAEMNLPIFTEYCISVNLLNQLDILLIEYLRKKFNFTTDQLAQIRTMVQTNHLRLLKPSCSCLITDVEEIHLNDQGDTIGSVPLIYCGLPTGKTVKTWIWQFDTLKTYHAECRTYMKVISMYL